MNYFFKMISYSIGLIFLLNACTPYQSKSLTGGYEDYALGNGKYKIIANGNGCTSASRVRAIAYLRAAEVTQEHGKQFFYVLEDNLQARSQYIGNGISVQKDMYQLIIQPTDNGDGLNAAELKYRYTKELKVKEKKAVAKEENPEMSSEGREEMKERMGQ